MMSNVKIRVVPSYSAIMSIIKPMFERKTQGKIQMTFQDLYNFVKEDA